MNDTTTLISELDAANAKAAKLFRKAIKTGSKADFDTYLVAYKAAKVAWRKRWAAEDPIKANGALA